MTLLLILCAYAVAVQRAWKRVDRPRCRVGDPAGDAGEVACERGQDDGLDDQPIQHLALGDPVPHADTLDGVQCEASGEDGQPVPQQPLARGTQLITPVDRPAQRALMRQRGRTPAGEQREPVPQPVRQLIDGEGTQPGRGELDRRRQPVQIGAQPTDLLPVHLADLEPRPDRDGPILQQAHRFLQRERRNREDMLTRDVQRVTTRRQDMQLGGGRQQRPRQLGAGPGGVPKAPHGAASWAFATCRALQAVLRYSWMSPPRTLWRWTRWAGRGITSGSSAGARRYSARWGLPVL